MSLNKKIIDDFKDAMKAKDAARLSSLRMLKAALKYLQVEKGRELDDSEVQAVISSLIRKGKEAAEEFKKGNRTDLAQKEEAELAIFYEYLPEQLQPDEIERILQETIAELSANSPSDLGKVMKAAMPKMAGKAQGKGVNEIARKLLSNLA
jgi:uncharacterized protein YqeY